MDLKFVPGRSDQSGEFQIHHSGIARFRASPYATGVTDPSPLDRIAAALERLAPAVTATADAEAPAYLWTGQALEPARRFAPLPLDLLTGIDSQRQSVLENSRRLARGHAAHDILLWGARGSGKSALVKSVVAALQRDQASLCLIEVPPDRLSTMSLLFAVIERWDRPVIIFVDDLGLDAGEPASRLLRSVLEGGANERPRHSRIYVTSNRRHIVARDMAAQAQAINPRDVADDGLALADRFGLSLGFHVCDQDNYLAMVSHYADRLGFPFDAAAALAWAAQRGARSGRVAWQFAVECAGRMGRSIDLAD